MNDTLNVYVIPDINIHRRPQCIYHIYVNTCLYILLKYRL